MARENSFGAWGRGEGLSKRKGGKMEKKKKNTIHLLYVSTYWHGLDPDIILDVYRRLSFLYRKE